MGIRKNAKFLTPAEKENYVRACVMMKADIVNPGAPAADRYSRWDEYVAIHAKIQNATAPGPITNINFGHGGPGAYGFLSWHRYFLFEFEQKLQTYVAGVTIPYWDWSDPATLTVASFLGPNGDPATANIVNQGYFAYNRPGSAATPAAGGVPAMPANATPLPAWWPAALPGWRLPGMFPAANVGGLKRKFRGLGALPPPVNIQETLTRPDYPAFQLALESGSGLITPPITMMHNAMHPFIGDDVGHMTDAKVSSFDPMFYVLHCNVDRLWAMWQMDGHATEFPAAGGDPQHHLNDIMYPWIGATVGYSTQSTVAPTIPMPGGLPLKRNSDTLNFRTLGYTYDSIPIIGLGLDRTGSMLGLTPDPMTGIGNVSKWTAATQGISAFLQDCETVKTSGLVYVIAGVKTFRSLPANDFVNVFGAPGYGLIKTGSPSFSKAVFDGAVGGMTPAGGTPLADALNNVQTTLVQAPFGNLPANERRYMAFLTDGMLTSGAPMNSIPDGSFTNTAIFGMGFGTGADVDYPTIASIVAKGATLATTQVFHGETAGTIDKFYANALAAAIGFTPLVDPVIELFAGEHAHIGFFATSAEDSFLITAQGMDFQDNNWSFMLHAPNDEMLYGDEAGHSHTSMGCHHCCPPPHITARRSNGRLTLVIQKGNTGNDCWVGRWELMVSYKAKSTDKMMMPDIGELMYPVSAGAIRGPRYARLLIDPKNRVATRNVATAVQHGLDGRAASTNSSNNEACSMLVNIYGRTRLKLNLQVANSIIKKGEELKILVDPDISLGSIRYHRAFVRFTAPAFDIAEILPPEKVQEIIKEIEASKRYNRKLDIALILAQYEKENKDIQFVKDKEGNVVSHEGGPLHVHEHDTSVPGPYHFGIYIEGVYFPGTEAKPDEHHGHQGAAAKMQMETGVDPDHVVTEKGEMFTRILNITVAVV